MIAHVTSQLSRDRAESTNHSLHKFDLFNPRSFLLRELIVQRGVMEWSPEEIAFVVEEFFASQKSIITAQRRFRRHFAKKTAPFRKVILRAVTNFRKTGNTAKRISSGRPRTSRSEANCALVENAIARSPSKSTRRLSQQVHIPRTSVMRIMTHDLKLYPYKVQIVQQILPADKVQRKAFSEWIINKCRDDNDFLLLLIASDEAHFNLSVYVNKQNFRFWARENPQNLHERPLHSKRVTVWCAMTSSCVIGPYFFEDDQGAAVTVTAERYNIIVRIAFTEFTFGIESILL